MTSIPSLVRDRSNEWLRAQNVPIHPYLPLIGREKLRPAPDVARRIVAQYCLAGIANDADPKKLLDWLDKEGGIGFLEPSDLASLQQESHTGEQINQLSWAEEALYMLCWCGKLATQLPSPDQECDLANLFSSIPPEREIADFIADLSLRDPDSIVQALDYYYSLHASIVHPELWNGIDPASVLCIPAVLERRHALEWISSPSEGWADIELNT
ncbi:DUF4272 domain-containing protein [Luteolibacter luteus]|uniref:DUF4272 domain-containing protein n=1 Tax=Luteolibacter luteus TaxID=2728835 RepID=A0A858RQ36_9BACT|nr:DUF4272 domain-containing protein [Luteolibacter luteus]QJE99147.1 DUF4272 domain-containing protein [Luteolibacter luteus]